MKIRILLSLMAFVLIQCKERQPTGSNVSQDGSGLASAVMNPSLGWNSNNYCQCDCTIPGSQSVYSRRVYEDPKVSKSTFQKCTEAAETLSNAIEKKSFYYNLNVNEATACMNRVKCYNSFSPTIILDKDVFEKAVGVTIQYPKVTRTEKFITDVLTSQNEYQNWLRRSGHLSGP